MQGGHFHVELVVVWQHDVGIAIDNDGTEFVGGYDKLAADVLLNDFLWVGVISEHIVEHRLLEFFEGSSLFAIDVK